MEIEQQLRDFLKALLDGDHAPVKNIDLQTIHYYIVEHDPVIGEAYCIELQLNTELDNFDPINYTHDFSRENNTNYKTEYEIISEFCVMDVELDKKKLLNFFKEKVPSDIISRSVLHSQSQNLFNNILRDKGISEYDVQYYDVIAFNHKCKFIIQTFKTKYSQLSFGEIRYHYYKFFLHTEIEKLRIELEKYFEKSHYDSHIRIIKFFCEKFLELKKKSTDKNIANCYDLIHKEVKSLHDHLIKYFKVPSSKTMELGKLIWNGSIEDFIDFFDHLIISGDLCYDESHNRYSIYFVLLANFHFDNSKEEVTLDSIINRLKLNPDVKDSTIEVRKLNYKKTRTQFAEEFGPLINIKSKEKSKLLFKGKSSRDPIVKELYKIFAIQSEKSPYTEIEEEVLIQAFKLSNSYR